jgi:hypothetical protein
MVSNTNQHPHPLPTTNCLYILNFNTEKGERRVEVTQREGKRGNSSQSWAENTNMTDCIFSL